jgi:hypothetical protein
MTSLTQHTQHRKPCNLVPYNQTEVKMIPSTSLFVSLVTVLGISSTEAFHLTVPTHERTHPSFANSCPTRQPFSGSRLQLSSSGDDLDADSDTAMEKLAVPKTEKEKADAVGNLVANDEWEGLTMELSELIRTAVIEDIKSNAREFLGKDDYKVGDISKEVDSRVKAEVARLRGKEVGSWHLSENEWGLFHVMRDDGKHKSLLTGGFPQFYL